MMKYRKYVVEFRGTEYDGKVAQRIGKFVFAKAGRMSTLSKIGIIVKVEVS